MEVDEDASLAITEVLVWNQAEFRNCLPEQLNDLVTRASFRSAGIDVDLDWWHVHIGGMCGVLRDHDLLGFRSDVNDGRVWVESHRI